MVTQSVKTKSELQAYMGKTITGCEGQVTIYIGKGEGISLQAGSSLMIGWKDKRGTKKGTEGIEIRIKNDTKTATTMTSYGSETKTRLVNKRHKREKAKEAGKRRTKAETKREETKTPPENNRNEQPQQEKEPQKSAYTSGT
jgi:hypothetical protein